MFPRTQRTSHPLKRQKAFWSGLVYRLFQVSLVMIVGSSVVDMKAAEDIDTQKEYNIKAVSIFSLGLQCDWPSHEDFPDKQFRIAIVGKDPFMGKLEMVAEKRKTLHDLPMVIEHPEGADAVGGCRMVFVPGTTDAKLIREILRLTRDTPTMVVGESTEFISSGGDASLTVEGGRIKLQLNAKSLVRKRIRPNAKLLKLATIVQEPEEVTKKLPL